MNFFQLRTLLLVTIIHMNINYCPTLCDVVLDSLHLPETDEDFWNWIFGSDDNQTDEHKPVDHIKEELEHHYGSKFLGLHDLKIQDELDFHIFNLHDFDKNKLLDGLEMLSMLDRHDISGQHHIHRTHSFEQNIAVIDMVLKTDDKNFDGFLDYNEFKSAKTKHNIRGL